MSQKKVGATKSDQQKILEMHAAGYTRDQIADVLYLRPEVVDRFTPEKQKKARKKVAEADKASQERHTKIMSKKSGVEEIQGKPSEG